MRLRRWVTVATLAATLGLSACSGSPGTGGGAAPAPSPTDVSTAPDPATPAPTDAGAGSPSPSPAATLAADRCLSGTYSLVRFVAVGGETYGTGQGGDVTLTFGDDRYTLAGAGKKPIVVTIGGQTGDLTVDGASKGTYRLKDDTATFGRPTTTGSGTLSAGSGRGQKLTMKQVNGVIGLAGDGKIACTAQAMTITLSAIRLELARV